MKCRPLGLPDTAGLKACPTTTCYQPTVRLKPDTTFDFGRSLGYPSQRSSGDVIAVVPSAITTSIANRRQRQQTALEADVQDDELHEPAGIEQRRERQWLRASKTPAAVR